MATGLVILGCGFTGREVARWSVAAGASVTATIRDPSRNGDLEAMGVRVESAPRLDRRRVEEIVSSDACVLVSFGPDGFTDAAIAPALAGARRIAYISTTGVYGNRRGEVDESTPVDASEPRAAVRLAAEEAYLAQGATVLRSAAIYGPGRGLHRRLKSGDFRIAGDGSNVVSRVHVADLARAVLAVFAAPAGKHQGQVFLVADDSPVPQIEVIRWLCQRLHVGLPEAAAIDQVAPTLRHDRSVNNQLLKRSLSFAFEYPSYREGFEACFAAEGVSPPG